MDLLFSAFKLSKNVYLKFAIKPNPTIAETTISKNVAKPPIAEAIFVLIITSKNIYKTKYIKRAAPLKEVKFHLFLLLSFLKFFSLPTQQCLLLDLYLLSEHKGIPIAQNLPS